MSRATPIRVLVVDDAAGICRLVSDCIARDPDVELIGTAENGRVGLAKIEQLEPDAVVLDVEMPEMNGLETVRRIRERRPQLPVIMFSGRGERGAAMTLEALRLGATDCAPKPPQAASLGEALQRVRHELLPRVKALAVRSQDLRRRALLARAESGAGSECPAELTAARPDVAAQAVAILAASGGPASIEALLQHLPAATAVPLIVCHHMPGAFTRVLAERLASASSRSFSEVRSGDVLAAGAAWIVPGGRDLRIEKRGNRLVACVSNQVRASATPGPGDVLLCALAATLGRGALAIVLGGLGDDGLTGAAAIRRAGGAVLVQDEASSLLWEMPGGIARAGLADRIAPPRDLALEIARRASLTPDAGPLRAAHEPCAAVA